MATGLRIGEDRGPPLHPKERRITAGSVSSLEHRNW
jgi:hypothetical protein